MFQQTIKRDLLVAYRNPADALNGLLFFIIVISLFPLGVGPLTETLRLIAPGVVWVSALLATLLSVETVFRSDFDDGSLEQMAVSMRPLLLIISGKIFSHWLISGLPLVLVSPILGLMLNVEQPVMYSMVLSLGIGTPVLSLLGGIGMSLVVGLQRSGLLLALLILPLYVPVLILGTSMMQMAQIGVSYQGPLLWMLALLALTASLGPIATLAGIRISLSQ